MIDYQKKVKETFLKIDSIIMNYMIEYLDYTFDSIKNRLSFLEINIKDEIDFLKEILISAGESGSEVQKFLDEISEYLESLCSHISPEIMSNDTLIKKPIDDLTD